MRFAALAVLLSALSGLGAGRVVVRPTDNGEALVNPGMGWTLHFYSNFIEKGDDGHRRYKVGSLRLGPRLAEPASAGK